MAISRSKFLLLLIIMSTVFCGYGWAQAVAGMGAISGMVYDQSGAVVPGAQVVISNPDKGITRTLVTTDAGVFSAPSLVPSSGYNLTVTMAGFAKWEAKDFGVLVGQTLTFKVTLQVTTAATQVEVTGVAPLVEDNKTGVTQVVAIRRGCAQKPYPPTRSRCKMRLQSRRGYRSRHNASLSEA
jgi:hypothetical protein